MAKGALRDFVRERLHLTNAEIAAAAVKAGFPLTRSKVGSHRHHIKHERKPRRSSKPRKLRKQAKAPDNPNPKADALRKLIFELGFDAARRVFEEFENMHRSMC